MSFGEESPSPRVREVQAVIGSARPRQKANGNGHASRAGPEFMARVLT